MSPARAGTRTDRSRVERTNHEATVTPPRKLQVTLYPGWFVLRIEWYSPVSIRVSLIHRPDSIFTAHTL